jgi:hypothetical protein
MALRNDCFGGSTCSKPGRLFSGFLFSCLLVFAGHSASAFDGFIKMTNGYFFDSATGQPWIPHGIAYQTWNRPLGVWQTYQQIDYDLDEMKKMGANSIRVDFVWQHIEENGDNQWNWTNYEYLVQAAESRGIRIFALVGYQWPPNWFPNDWYTMHPPGLDSSGIYHPTRWQSDIINYEHPSARAQYAEWFQNVCGHFKDSKAIVGWIVGNEYGYLGLWSLKYDGYDPQCEAAFRTWCAGHYASVSNLNTAWGSNYTNFNQVVLADEYGWKGTNGAECADMVQWHEDSIASFTAVGAAAARGADTNHLLSYSTVGMQWGEEDWRYHAEDRGKIAQACASNNAPLGFFSINNYPWAMDGSETRNGQWGISFTKKRAGVPVIYSETGFTSSETLFPGMTLGRQGALIRNALWESLEAGGIGTHIFAWNDRPYITDREKGFGILYADRVIKPAFWTSRDTFSLMEQVDIGKHLMGSQDPKPDIAFFWDEATDSQYVRFENEMQHEAGALERLGYEPNFLMGVSELASGAYTNYKAIILPRNMRVSDAIPGYTNSVLNFFLTQVIPKGIHVIAVADVPGMQDRWGKPRAAFSNEVAQLFGVDASDVGGNFPAGSMDDSIYRNYYHKIDVRYNAAAPGRLTNYVYSPSVWKYNDRVRVTDGTLWAVLNSGTNRGYESSSSSVPGWETWGNVYPRQWGWQYEGTNMVQLWGWSGMWQNFQAIPGQKYTADAWMRSNADDGLSNGTYGVVMIEWYDIYTNQIGSSVESPRLTAANNAWQYFSVSSIAPTNVALGRIVRKLDRPTVPPIGSLYFDSDTYVPAVVAKNHGAGKAILVLNALDCLPDGDGNGQPDNLPYKWRSDILGGILQDYCGVQPSLKTLGTNAYLCLPEYRTCTNGAILMQVKNYLYDPYATNGAGGDWQVFTIQSDLVTGKTIRAFEQCRVVETNSDGVFTLALPPDGQEMLLAYNPPGGTNIFVQIANAPSVVHPYGDQSYGIYVNYDTGGKTGLILKVAFIAVGDNGFGATNKVYQMLWTNAAAGPGANTFWLWIPDPDQSDPGYRSTPDGGNYIITSWLEDASSNKMAETIPQTTELKWGIKPIQQVPLNISKGNTTNMPVEWEDLDEQLYWQNTPLMRGVAFPNRVAVYRSTKTEAMYSNQFARVNAVCDWLETMGYESANLMDISFDNVTVTAPAGTNQLLAALFSDTMESGTNGWTATGLWHQSKDLFASPTNSWSYNNGSNYMTGARSTGAITRALSLSNATSGVSLRFKSWYETEDTGTAWDRKLVQISTNGTIWTTLLQISGTNKQWVSHVIDLSAYAGKMTWIRFSFDTIDSMNNRYQGWFIDDLEVLALEASKTDFFYDSMESTTNWAASGLWRQTGSRSNTVVSGTNRWVYNRSAANTNYSTGVRNSGSLLSGWINLNGLSGATLTFRSWYQTEDTGTKWDRKQVYLTTDGNTWTKVYDVSGVAGQWTQPSLDLGAYAGQPIRIKFTFDTIDAGNNNFEGWYIDDVRISTLGGVGSTAFSDRSETGTNEWSASGLWHLASDQSFSTLNSWAYNNGVNYNTGGRNSGSLVSRWIDLSDAVGAALAFRSWYETEDAGIAWDRKLVQISTNGVDWVQLAQVAGPNKQWTAQTVDLSPYAGQRIRLKFFFDTVDNMFNYYRGWYLDDIEVKLTGINYLFSDDFSTTATNWTRVAGAGNWDAVNNTLRAWRIGNDDNILCANTPVYTNCIVGTTVRYNKLGPYFNDAEIYVRYQNRDNFIKVGIHNFYGFWRLKYTVRVQTNNLYSGWIYEFSRTNQPTENTWYNLKVQAETNTFRVFLNGDNVGSFTDTNFPSGRIAVGTKAVQLGIWEPAKGYFFIDDDEYSYSSPVEGEIVTIGKPLNLDWGYLVKFFPLLILPGTYVMNDTEASNVATWLTNGWFSLMATDGGVAMKDETGADDPGRIESLFGVAADAPEEVPSLNRVDIGTNVHYATLDYNAQEQVALDGSAKAWKTLTQGANLGTLYGGSTSAPALICNVMTQKIDSPPKVFCFNYGVDTGGQLTNESRLLSQRAFEWLHGQTYMLTLELKYVLFPNNPNLDVVVFSTNFWTLNGWGTNSLNVQIPMDNVMTGTNLYWVMYTYPWDATNSWRTHKGFFSSGNDGQFTTLGGFGLQLLGITQTAFAGRDWDMWVAYNTQGSNLLTHFGVKEKGSLANEDNFNDGNANGWTVTPNTNVTWSVVNGALRSAVTNGGYSWITKDALAATGQNLTVEFNMRWMNSATNSGDGGLIYRGVALGITPRACGWRDAVTNLFTNNLPATGVWHHVMFSVRDGLPYPKSDLVIDSKTIFLDEPIEETNWTSSISLLSPYYKGYIEWDNFRAADEEYSLTTQSVFGVLSPTNANFWSSVPDYDPDKWEYDGTALGGRYEWYIYFKGEGVHGYKGADIYFSPRLKVENSNFPCRIRAGTNALVGVDWENLGSNQPALLLVSLENPLLGATYAVATNLVTNSTGSAWISVSVPSNAPVRNDYCWVAYLCPTNVAVSNRLQERIGLDDTFRFGSDGLPVEPETIISVIFDGTAYNDYGIPPGFDFGTWQGGSSVFSSTNVDATAPEGGIDCYTWGTAWTGWDIHRIAGVEDMSAYSNGYLKFYLKSSQNNMKIELQGPPGTTRFVTVGSTTNAWKEISIPITSFSGVELSTMYSLFSITSPGGAGTTNYVDYIRWTKE